MLRCAQLPRFVTWQIPDVDALFEDDRLLIQAFAHRGIEAESVVWSDPAVDWSSFDLALLRSTWDYVDAPTEFIDRLGGISAVTRLVNPLRTVAWNSTKAYLDDLASWDIPVVPSFRVGSVPVEDIQETFAAHGWSTAVLKPLVGAGASGVHPVPTRELAEAVARTRRHPAYSGQDEDLDATLVQPFVDSVVGEGEWSFVHIGGELSHVLLKRPARGDYRAHVIYGGTTERVTADPNDAAESREILAALPYDATYARADLVRRDGRLEIMELELIEPILYLSEAPEAADRLVSAVVDGAADA